jgi:LPXTG-motif cell wall-anchored protein
VQQPAARAGSGRTATPAPDRTASGSRLPATGPAGATLLPAVVLLLLAGLLRRRHS